jgi:two-component system response regulator AtoC
MESELFGHEKGSFTGAAARKQGLFELAGRGSIFLDEVGEMPMPLQVKLLRVLQEKKVRRLGGNSDIPVTARIISATNRDIEALVRKGRFREDLYYRLNVFRLSIPPLRERKEDIPLLADHLLSRLCARMGRPRPEFAPGAGEILSAYPFPGNIRELENILERAIIYCEGNIVRQEDIDLHRPRKNRDGPAADGPPHPSISPPPISSFGSSGSPNLNSMEEIEKKAILDTLAKYKGNRTRAAEALGISRKTILNKLKAWGL